MNGSDHGSSRQDHRSHGSPARSGSDETLWIRDLLDGLFVQPLRRNDREHKPLTDFEFPDAGTAPPPGELEYAVTTIDRRGRLAARSIVTKLGWSPGHRLAISVHGELVKVRTSGLGRPLHRDGFLVLPSPVRSRARLYAGNRVLMAASTRLNLLVLFPPRSASAALWAHLPSIWK